MKTNLLFILIFLWACNPPAETQTEIPAETTAQQHPLVGTWQLVYGKLTDAEGNVMEADSSIIDEYKIITPTHYMLISNRIDDGQAAFDYSLAGSVQIAGNRYIEIPELASRTENTPVSTDFSWELDTNGHLIQRGTVILANGSEVKLDELVFRRVESPDEYPNHPGIGVWNQLSSSYSMPDGTIETHSNETTIRFQIFTPTHWMRFSQRDGQFENVMGGTYRMEGEKLYPKFEFGNFSPHPSHTYEVSQKLEGDKLHFNGTARDAEGKTLTSFQDVFQKIDQLPAEVASNQ
jgi:hypothetical protein